MSDYCELKKRAMDATPGPWYEQDDEDSAAGAVFVMPESDVWMPPICRITTEANAAYVAAANPAAILELIAENESLRKDAERYRFLMQSEISDDHSPTAGFYVIYEDGRGFGDLLCGDEASEAIDAAISSPENP